MPRPTAAAAAVSRAASLGAAPRGARSTRATSLRMPRPGPRFRRRTWRGLVAAHVLLLLLAASHHVAPQATADGAARAAALLRHLLLTASSSWGLPLPGVLTAPGRALVALAVAPPRPPPGLFSDRLARAATAVMLLSEAFRAACWRLSVHRVFRPVQTAAWTRWIVPARAAVLGAAGAGLVVLGPIQLGRDLRVALAPAPAAATDARAAEAAAAAGVARWGAVVVAVGLMASLGRVVRMRRWLAAGDAIGRFAGSRQAAGSRHDRSATGALTPLQAAAMASQYAVPSVPLSARLPLAGSRGRSSGRRAATARSVSSQSYDPPGDRYRSRSRPHDPAAYDDDDDDDDDDAPSAMRPRYGSRRPEMGGDSDGEGEGDAVMSEMPYETQGDVRAYFPRAKLDYPTSDPEVDDVLAAMFRERLRVTPLPPRLPPPPPGFPWREWLWSTWLFAVAFSAAISLLYKLHHSTDHFVSESVSSALADLMQAT
ncbi:hypothetical protein CXG81DRAFT_17031 [Caulochytrium protostelioides]|uniref:Uncharacterized protein n=1 Tax=Caulochytrium protostelioides TaxID=1555241 RepID=A0A4P9XD83_9FUNG|nr:hypothetical protein CXG81DRAFT_17031 [Caulochytrium protostelioides]|eukprot:RKP03408.1 hypothetical protein CXG81DRAFT_17031 [Caulochytrium protostelioides]